MNYTFSFYPKTEHNGMQHDHTMVNMAMRLGNEAHMNILTKYLFSFYLYKKTILTKLYLFSFYLQKKTHINKFTLYSLSISRRKPYSHFLDIPNPPLYRPPTYPFLKSPHHLHSRIYACFPHPTMMPHSLLSNIL